ncbi:DUF4304 domain-containing protein [Hyphomonas polymorpha]|nr:DUF4304 domain-containing protein [Hyphomonas polymorpha]
MAKTSPRIEMDKALKQLVVPLLRTLGFQGSYPHFRRMQNEQIDLLSFSFSRFGGEFSAELAICPVDGFRYHSGKLVPPEKVTAFNILSERTSLRNPAHSSENFVFGKPSFEPNYDVALPRQYYEHIATQLKEQMSAQLSEPFRIRSRASGV